MKNFRNEISWDGILAIVAIIGITAGAVLYCAETNATAKNAQKAVETVAVQQSNSDKLLAAYHADSDKHFAKIDNAITMIGTVLAERTGKSLPSENNILSTVPSDPYLYGETPALPVIDPPKLNSSSTNNIDTTTVKQK